MKIRIEKIASGEDEVIIRCRELTPQIDRLLRLIGTGPRLIGLRDGLQVPIDPSAILYIEAVDGRVFVCTDRDVLQVDYTLAQLEQVLDGVNFFRCSKSMILNIDKVRALRSLASNRIDATMAGGEHILISRTYASEFRKRLKGGSPDDETAARAH